MTTTTTNFSFVQPQGSDTVDETAHVANAFALIDTQCARMGFKGTDIASAAALTLPAQGSVFDVTGTTTVTSLSTRTAGEVVVLEFDGILTLTHNATTLALAGNANATTAAGDIYVFQSEGSGNWRELSRFIRATAPTSYLLNTTGLVLVGQNNTEATSTSTTDIDAVTVSSLSIAATTPFIVMCHYRKTADIQVVRVGLKLNTTVTHTAVNVTDSTAAVSSGLAIFFIGPRVTSYLRAGWGIAAGVNNVTAGDVELIPPAADFPTATITDVIIRTGANSAITYGIDEVRVYTLPTTVAT